MALGVSAQPAGVVLDTLQVRHVDFQGQTQQGIVVCNREIADDLRAIFLELYRRQYPIERIRPISDYDDDDERSMQANTHRATATVPLRAARNCRTMPWGGLST